MQTESLEAMETLVCLLAVADCADQFHGKFNFHLCLAILGGIAAPTTACITAPCIHARPLIHLQLKYGRKLGSEIMSARTKHYSKIQNHK
jgi:hypothetical protein